MPFDPLLFFGDAGNGDLVALVPYNSRPDVFVWDHENDSHTWVTPSLAKYLEWSRTGQIRLYPARRIRGHVGGRGHPVPVTSMMSTGAVRSLHHREREIARPTVTGTDFPWAHANLQTLPGFDEFPTLFAGQEQAIDMENHKRGRP